MIALMFAQPPIHGKTSGAPESQASAHLPTQPPLPHPANVLEPISLRKERLRKLATSPPFAPHRQSGHTHLVYGPRLIASIMWGPLMATAIMINTHPVSRVAPDRSQPWLSLSLGILVLLASVLACYLLLSIGARLISRIRGRRS